MKQYSLIATCASGIEALVSKELKDLGYSRENENGRVRFLGDLSDVAKTNIWLRTADRIKIVMGEFKATTFDQLFEQTKAIAWEDTLPSTLNSPFQGNQ